MARRRRIKRALAKKLRRDQTRAERLAWRILRNRGCLGLKFRRQKVIRGFVADFYCPQLNLVLEIDGSIHESVEHSGYDHIAPSCSKLWESESFVYGTRR